MTEQNQSGEAPDQSNVIPIRHRQSHQEIGDFDQEIDPNQLGDVDFAHHRLTKWAHPANISHVVEVIASELKTEQQDDDDMAPAKVGNKRLIKMLTDEKYAHIDKAVDPFLSQFLIAFNRASTIEQLHALEAVQRLHWISISSDINYFGPNNHVRELVLAILGHEPPRRTRFLRAVPDGDDGPSIA